MRTIRFASAAFNAPVPFNNVADASTGQPFVADNGDLYVSSTRAAAGPSDIYRLPLLPDGGFATAERVTKVSTQDIEASPLLSFDALSLYFFSSGRDGISEGRIWVAHRTSLKASFDTGTLVQGLRLDGGGLGEDAPMWLSADNCRLYFTSSRSGVPQMYVATRP